MEIPIKYEELQLDKICRICLLEQENIHVISEVISGKLADCTSIKIPDGRVLLCNSCENEINKWHSFKEQVIRAFEICKMISHKDENFELSIKIEDSVNEDHGEKAYHKHKCTKCSESFPTHGKLRTHMKVHKMEEGYTCELCSKKFHTAQSLWRHKRRHEQNKPYPCTKCKMTFPFKHALDRHFQAKHEADANFLCSYCPKKYKVKETLVAHIKKNHSGEASGAVCNVCGKFCLSIATLKVHLRSHTGERPFVCDFCSKGFMTKDHLTLHRRIHTGERPFTCNECGKGFISSSVLKKHKRSHSGERPYKCHLCDKTFSLSSAFKTHLKCH